VFFIPVDQVVSMPALRLRFLLFALALAVQAFLPVASGVAAAGGNARAGLSEICFKAVGSLDPDDGRAAPGHVHQRECPLCQAFCDGVAPVEASAVVLGAFPAPWATLRWIIAESTAPAASAGFAHRARAPPAA
jgi:hypothetical protein